MWVVLCALVLGADASSQPSSAPTSAPVEATPESQPLPEARSMALDELNVVAGSLGQARVAGSAHAIDQKRLETFSYGDVHRVVAEVPGVYVRDEDGFGLRPNIGMRGASSDRSAKITLMEDGVLFAPAPYSAPAAYYFPLMSRITGVEVYKGPASIRFGPNTVGGAINLLTRPIPRKLAFALDVGGGMYGGAKALGHLGYGNDRFGVLLEGALVRSDGFKRLPSRGPTGFSRTEWLLKAVYNTAPGAALLHQFDLKAGYSGELSNETYLGLSDADFARDPYQRYAASNDDVMRSWRTQAGLGYSLLAGEMFELNLRAYRHDQHRAWTKLNGIAGAPLDAVFRDANSPRAATLIASLKGEADSSAADALLIGTNDRRFVAQGVQATAIVHPVLGPVRQDIELGLRLHHDQIVRRHDERPFAMVSGTLLPQGPLGIIADNTARAIAFAAHLQDVVQWRRLLVTPGLRFEYITTTQDDRLQTAAVRNRTIAVLPGIGAYYGIRDWIGVLAGVHRGFSPKAPGQSDGAQPELSINYEAGARAAWRGARTRVDAEAIGFFNDYQNLTAHCTQAGGCSQDTLDRQFSAGAVFVYGAEAALKAQHDFGIGLELHGQASYTLTLSEFRQDFNSQNPLWGSVRVGDRLPYVPEHQGSVSIGVSMARWGVDLQARAQSMMRDLPGQGPIAATDALPAYAYLDAAAYYVLPANIRVYVTIDNLTDARYMVSRRPFGARPGKPFLVMAGVRYQF